MAALFVVPRRERDGYVISPICCKKDVWRVPVIQYVIKKLYNAYENRAERKILLILIFCIAELFFWKLGRLYEYDTKVTQSDFLEYRTILGTERL